jgi:hypothetical protein
LETVSSAPAPANTELVLANQHAHPEMQNGQGWRVSDSNGQEMASQVSIRSVMGLFLDTNTSQCRMAPFVRRRTMGPLLEKNIARSGSAMESATTSSKASPEFPSDTA